MIYSFPIIFCAIFGLSFPTAAASKDCTSWRGMRQQLYSATSHWSARWHSSEDPTPIHIHKKGAEITVEDRNGQRTLAWKDAVEGLHLLALEFHFPADLATCPLPRHEAIHADGDITITIKTASNGVFESTLTLKGRAVGSATLTLQEGLPRR
ncbi:MAG: hypothetical protein ACK4OE_11080 [Acidovorax sp.]|uniref:hypothetical protein n=1 Tax=Acidovorax sp. TaxID=1872122 RepID=UPI00391A315A